MPTLYISPCAGEVIAASSASSVAYVPLMSRPVPVSPFSPVSPLSPGLPLSPFEPLEPFFTLKVLTLPFESVTVTMFSPPSAVEVVVCSTLVTLTPSAPFAPVAPVAPVSPFAPVSPLSPVLPVSPFEPLEPFFTENVPLLPSERVTVTMFVPPSEVEVVVCSTLTTPMPSLPFVPFKPSLPGAPVAPVAPVSPFSPVSPLSPFTKVKMNSTPSSVMTTFAPAVSPLSAFAPGLLHLLASAVMVLMAAVRALNSLDEITSSSS